MKIFIEESGDLGFSERASKFFVIGAAIAEDDICAGRCFKKARETLGKKRRDAPELKSYNTDDKTKRRIFECLSKCKFKIAYALLRKEQVYPYLREEQSKLYNYLIGTLIVKILENYEMNAKIQVIIDKSQYNFTREHFNDYLSNKMLYNGYHGIIYDKLLNIEHIDSRKCNGIQVSDFIAGCIYRRYRDDDNAFYSQYLENRLVCKIDFFKDWKN